MICETCNHESKEPEPHKAGECKQCNCGQSEVMPYHTPMAVNFRCISLDADGSRHSGKRVMPAWVA